MFEQALKKIMILYSGSQEAILKHSICCGCFFHLAGGELQKSLHERGEGRKQAHLWLFQQPSLLYPITIPASPRGRCGKGRETKGGRERQRKEEIVGEIYMPLQQLTEGWVNLLLIIHTQNKLDPWLWASCTHKQTPAYLPWWHRTTVRLSEGHMGVGSCGNL